MKRLPILIFYIVASALTAAAQARFTSHTENIGFGQIEWKHPVTAQYAITNTGNLPLVISEVEPDCACTDAQWTQTPIGPGEKGVIRVTYDAKLLGRFQKSVAIYTNAEPHLVYLYFHGEVVQELKDFTKTHPYLIGSLRTDMNSLDFPDVCYGQHPTLTLGVVNLSDMPYEPVLMHLPTYLHAEANPTVLQKGERGTVTVTLDPARLNELGLTQTSVYLARFAGDKVSEENEIPVSAVLLPDFSTLSAAEREQAPVVRLSADSLDMSEALVRKQKVRQDITLTNAGRSPLQISKLQVFHPAVGVALKKSMLLPGESTRLRVTVTRKNIGKKRHHLRLLMITNDPVRPKVEINIKTK